MAISCFGYLPEDLDFVFNPLATVTAEQAEELAGKLSDRVEKLYSAGLLTYQEARSELKTVGEKYAAYSGVDPDAEPPSGVDPDAEPPVASQIVPVSGQVVPNPASDSAASLTQR